MAKQLHAVDATITRYLNEGRESAGLTYRQIAARTGMSINRIGIILRYESPPATLGEIRLIASSFNASASALVSRAEEELGTASSIGAESVGAEPDAVRE